MGESERSVFFVYVLLSEVTGRRYVGSTRDIDERLRRHNSGHSKSTKAGRPWILAYSEEFPTRAAAVNREMYLKTGAGREWLDGVLKARAA